MSTTTPLTERSSSALLLIASGVLLLGLLYIIGKIYVVPYPGFSFDGQWQISNPQTGCTGQESTLLEDLSTWCTRTAGLLQQGDTLLSITDPESGETLTWEDYRASLLQVPMYEKDQGDEVLLSIERNGAREAVAWPMKGPTLRERLSRLIETLFFLPFWLAGTGTLLFFRPRNTAWYLLIGFNYLTGLWFIVGSVSVYHVFGSSIALVVLSWIMAPLYIHLHALLPVPIKILSSKLVSATLYASALLIIGLSLVQIISPYAYLYGTLLGIVGSLLILLYRTARPASRSSRLTTYLMLLGIGIATLPGVLLWIVPLLVTGTGPPSALVTTLVTLVLPALPLFYAYALYKDRLGEFEMRANRALTVYAFTAVYATVFIILFILFYQQPELNMPALTSALGASALCMLGALLTWERFKGRINRLAYGTVYEPEQLVRQFANEIPRALNRRQLVTVLTTEVMPTLLIRQSALIWFTASEPIVYSQNTEIDPDQVSPENRSLLLEMSGRYLLQEERNMLPLDWVRLAIPISIDERSMGIWLLGRRDPDDYYPQSDIDLLTTLGNQIAVALETIRLFQIARERSNELEQANLQLRRASQYKDDLLRNVTHELRTPLATIYGYTELMTLGEGGDVSDEQKEMLEYIANSAESLSQLVTDIIFMQKKEASAFVGKETTLDEVARESMRRTKVLFARENVRRKHPCHITLDVDPDPPPAVWADPTQLGQVFDNLLQNAWKFSPHGGEIRIELKAGSYTFDNRQSYGNGTGTGLAQPSIFASIQDPGIGIPDEEQDKIWQSFYQVDASSTRQYGGTGIGLSLVREIIEIHGGDIWVDSEVGRGSTFTLVLPIHEAKEHEAKEHQV